MLRELGWALAGFGALLGVLVACCVVVLGDWSPMVREEFEAELWRSAPESDAPARAPSRQRMVDDLLARGSLEGARRRQVLALLGPPDSSSGEPGATERLSYWLGPERDGFGIDSEWLAVTLGEDGVVAGVRLRTD